MTAPARDLPLTSEDLDRLASWDDGEQFWEGSVITYTAMITQARAALALKAELDETRKLAGTMSGLRDQGEIAYDALKAECERLQDMVAAKCEAKYVEIERERDALAAHVETLRKALERFMGAAMDADCLHRIGAMEFGEARAALASTPAQSLASVRAEAMREAAQVAQGYAGLGHSRNPMGGDGPCPFGPQIAAAILTLAEKEARDGD